MLSDGVGVGKMASSIKKQSILITGCSEGGIGYETAKYLKALGHDVFASARKQEEVDRLQSEGFDAYLMDVRNEKEIEITLAQILKKRTIRLMHYLIMQGLVKRGRLRISPLNI